MKPLRIFLSAVSRQFEPCRIALASDLRAVGVEVVVQEDFRQHGRTLLEKLDAYIEGCDRVIALVGDAYGAEPPEGAVAADLPRRSHTQWEYAFAMGERLDGSRAPRKDIFVYFARDEYLKAHSVDEDPQRKALQEEFRRAIVASGEDRSKFSSLDELCRLALRDGFQIRDPSNKTVHLPYRSIGKLFKGRDAFLGDLRRRLGRPNGHAAAIVAPQVVYGLGGVGKTRAAIEYAWKFAGDYTALLFISAPTPDDLHSRLSDLVGILKIDTAVTEVVARLNEVLRWLDAHPGWLLIVDNVDTEDAAEEVEKLLARLTTGHVLITSRLANWSAGVEPLELDLLAEDDAIAFLLERTDKRLMAADDNVSACRIASELAGLALALEQAGAYINQQRLRLSEYFTRWQIQKDEVLRWYNPRLMRYPESVAVTWETTFIQLMEPERRLLEVLSWLAPEPIPLSLFESPPLSAFVSGPRTALAGLAGYSLARFGADADRVTVHRLVQEVTRTRTVDPERFGSLDAALKSVNDQVPSDSDDVRTWGSLISMVPHAEAVARHADSAGILSPTGRLMSRLASYQMASARYTAAEPLFRRALAISESSYRSDHPSVATDLGNLAVLLSETGRGVEAEPLFRRALAISESSYGSDHPSVAIGLNNLAGLLRETGRSAEAEPLFRRALAIDESSYRSDHPSVATDLNNLALLLSEMGRLAEAEPLFRRALAIDESSYGSDHPRVATDLGNLALLLRETGRSAEAEPLFRRALAISESSYGSDHPRVATRLGNLALLLGETGRSAEAEPLFRRALAIWESSYGADHPRVAIGLNNLAGLLRETGRGVEAEPLFHRALAILLRFGRDTGHEHPDLRAAIGNFEALLGNSGHDEAAIRERLAEVGRPFGFAFGDHDETT